MRKGFSQCKVSVAIPTFNRTDKLAATLEKIGECQPAPSEILVHIDAGDASTEPMLRTRFPEVQILSSPEKVGPGGGRNKLMEAARCPYVAHFDDDSYPTIQDFFRRVEELFDRYPKAGVLAAHLEQAWEKSIRRIQADCWVADFVGCACAIRMDAFSASGGYVPGYEPLPLAYGMEEQDLSIRLHGTRWGVLKTGSLKVYHDTLQGHRMNPTFNRANIANIALMCYLRYPLLYWWVGGMQVLRLVRWLRCNGRTHGTIRGITDIPIHAWRYKEYRSPVSPTAFRKFFALRHLAKPVKQVDRIPIRIGFPAGITVP